MRRFVTTLLMTAVFCLAVLWTGCIGSKKAPVSPAQVSQVPSGVPGWFSELPGESNYFYASATASSKNKGLALIAAKQEGMKEIAGQISTKVSGMFKRFSEEIGAGEDAKLMAQTTAVSKSVVEETISGCGVEKQDVRQEGTSYHAYVLMKMPIKIMNATVLDKVKMDENMYARFRSSKAFKELETEVEKRDKTAKEQG